MLRVCMMPRQSMQNARARCWLRHKAARCVFFLPRPLMFVSAGFLLFLTSFICSRVRSMNCFPANEPRVTRSSRTESGTFNALNAYFSPWLLRPWQAMRVGRRVSVKVVVAGPVCHARCQLCNY